jgi:hypothetical protein
MYYYDRSSFLELSPPNTTSLTTATSTLLLAFGDEFNVQPDGTGGWQSLHDLVKPTLIMDVPFCKGMEFVLIYYIIQQVKLVVLCEKKLDPEVC